MYKKNSSFQLLLFLYFEYKCNTFLKNPNILSFLFRKNFILSVSHLLHHTCFVLYIIGIPSSALFRNTTT